MIPRPSLATVLSFIAIFVLNVTALWIADIVRFAPHLELRQPCSHVGPGALVIIGVMSLAATMLITLSVRLWFYKPGKR